MKRLYAEPKLDLDLDSWKVLRSFHKSHGGYTLEEEDRIMSWAKWARANDPVTFRKVLDGTLAIKLIGEFVGFSKEN